jgi:PAS domain-containing protein
MLTDIYPVQWTGRQAAAITPAVVCKLVDALADGVALIDGGGTLAQANLRLEEMFGYPHGELTGRPVESLMPADLQAAHCGHRAAYAQAPRAQAPRARAMGTGPRLVALRKDRDRLRPRRRAGRSAGRRQARHPARRSRLVVHRARPGQGERRTAARGAPHARGHGLRVSVSAG